MIHKDSIAGLLLLALAAGYYFMTGSIPSSSLSDEVGADGMPKLLASALAIVACMLIAKGLLATRRPVPVATVEDDVQEHSSINRAMGFAALGVGYMFVAPFIGFAAGVAAIVVAVALYEREPLSPKLLGVGIAGGIGFWLVFVFFLGTEQPVSSILALVMKSRGA
jgi:putative tricarboxylic transport membrane protein